MLAIEGVHKAFGDRPVLHGLDLHVETGRTTVLIGPSGCGKSTIVRLMNGLLAPDAGRVLAFGSPLGGQDILALRRRMGYVIQGGGLFPHLDARDNIALVPRYLRWPAARVEARLAQLIELTRFPSDGLARFPAELSGGQRQRVALMRALMLDPDVLLLDEPLGALDPMVRSEVQEDLRRVFVALRKTVLLVTHDLGEAAFLADEVVLLRDGRIVQHGPIAELLHAPADPFVRAFIHAQRGLLDAEAPSP